MTTSFGVYLVLRFNLFCNVWVCVCVLMCGCSDNCVGVLIICVLVFIVFCIVCIPFLYRFVYIYRVIQNDCQGFNNLS
jgi:hypothetical protein